MQTSLSDDRLTFAPGTIHDYDVLASHHYRSGRPGTCARVLTLRSDRPTVVGRFIQRRDESRAVAVLVESMPMLSCRLRDVALDGRYRRAGTNAVAAGRAALLNCEMRTISRVIVHPQWRGLGLATWLVRAALDDATTIFTEALAAMGDVHPFFERAGMAAHHRPMHEHDARLLAALQRCGLTANDLLVIDDLRGCIDALDEPLRCMLERELLRWQQRATRGGVCGRRTTDGDSWIIAVLHDTRQRLLCAPVYFLHDNRLPGATDGTGE